MEVPIFDNGDRNKIIGTVRIPDEVYPDYFYNNSDITLFATCEYDTVLDEWNVIAFNYNGETMKYHIEQKARTLFEEWKKETSMDFVE